MENDEIRKYQQLSQSKLIIENAKRVSSLISSYTYKNVVTGNPLEKIIVYLLQSQSENGSWGTPDYPPWTDVITGLSIQLLTRLGFHAYSSWEIIKSGVPKQFIGGIQIAINYLSTSQLPSGQWGEDVFDTCQVVKALLPFRNDPEVSKHIDLGIQYIDQAILSEKNLENSGEWAGPGFYAAIVEVFNILGKLSQKPKLVDILLHYQNEDGSFTNKQTSHDNGNIDLCVWHTSLAIITLNSLGIPSQSNKLSHAVNWLEQNQNEDGSWGVALIRHKAIYTGYGVIALAKIKSPKDERVLKGVNWLTSHQISEGRVGGQEGTIMASLAFSEVFPSALAFGMPLNVIIDVQKSNKECIEELERLENEFIKIDKKNIVLSKDLTQKEIQIHKYQEKETKNFGKITQIVEQMEKIKEESIKIQKQLDNYPIKISKKGLIILIVVILIALVIVFTPLRSLITNWVNIKSTVTQTITAQTRSMPTKIP